MRTITALVGSMQRVQHAVDEIGRQFAASLFRLRSSFDLIDQLFHTAGEAAARLRDNLPKNWPHDGKLLNNVWRGWRRMGFRSSMCRVLRSSGQFSKKMITTHVSSGLGEGADDGRQFACIQQCLAIAGRLLVQAGGGRRPADPADVQRRAQGGIRRGLQRPAGQFDSARAVLGVSGLVAVRQGSAPVLRGQLRQVRAAWLPASTGR